ncbi:MAG: helix-turn-helix domain-containing protein, partial [Azonexus sp.]|nr:helix-turn-helix domain-containing protein [Azonexus sp.]
QEQLAEAVDLHPGYLGAVERGEKNISLLNILALCQALPVRPSDLMTVLDLALQKPAVERPKVDQRIDLS